MQFAWQPGNLNYTTVDFTAKKPGNVALYENPHRLSTNDCLNSYLFSGLPAKIDKVRTHQRSFFHPHTSRPTTNVYPSEQLLLSSERQDRKVTTHERTEKKFFIFDRSGAETRMILGSIRPPVANPAAITAKPIIESEQGFPEVHDLYESREDHVSAEGSDYNEDTEEINALLYSDNDDINDDNCDGGDEDEMSTGRSPLALENGHNDTQQEDDYEDVTSPPKRRKLEVPPGQYGVESVVDVNTCGEESCSTVGAKRSMRDKIREKLRIIENLVSGSKSKDPLVILEEAIDYLKSLKGNASSPHVEDQERPDCCGSRV